MHTRGVAVGITLGLLLISPMFLAVDYQKFFSASSDLDLFVNPYFPFYVSMVAASLALVLLLPTRKRQYVFDLFFLGGVMILMSGYATFLSTSLRSASPFALLAVTEPIHVATAKDILVHGHLAVGEVFYHSWPLSFLLLAMLSGVLGIPVAGIPYVNFLLSTALQFLVLLCLYLLGKMFYGHGAITVFLYYVAAFYFFGGGGGTLAGFSPQLFAFPFIVLYIIVTYKGMKRGSVGINVLLLLFTFVIVFSNITSAAFLACFVSSTILVQRLAHSSIFGALAVRISVICVAVLAWLIYFVSFDFAQLFAPSTGGGFWSFLAQYALSSATGSGNPYLAVTVWYVALLKLYRTWVILLPMLAGILGFLFFVRTEKSPKLRYLAMAIGLSFAAFAVFDMVFLRVFENFWERIFSLGYPFLALFALTILRTLRSHVPRSLRPFVGKKALGFSIFALILMSFLASNVSLTLGYSSSEFSTATFLSRHCSDCVLGMSHQFYEILRFPDIEKRYSFDQTIFHSDYDMKFFTARLSEQPTFYDTGTIVRTNREVAFFYAAFGIQYSDFWGKIDYSLTTKPGFDRVFDSGSERIFSQ